MQTNQSPYLPIPSSIPLSDQFDLPISVQLHSAPLFSPAIEAVPDIISLCLIAGFSISHFSNRYDLLTHHSQHCYHT